MRMLALVGLLIMSATALAETADLRDPAEIVRDTTSMTLQSLTERRSEFEADPALLQELIRDDLLPLIDIDRSARLILGRAGRTATTEQMDAFADAMSELLINRYSDGLLAFKSDGQMEVMPLKGNNSDKLTRVRTRIKLENGGFAPVDFAFHRTDAGWKAFDITVEGISYVMTYRNQLSPLVSANGIEQVTADLSNGSLQLKN